MTHHFGTVFIALSLTICTHAVEGIAPSRSTRTIEIGSNEIWSDGRASAVGQDIQWQIVKPSNTGIPGEEVRVMRWAPDGKLWVAARWPFWQEGGIGIYDITNDIWSTHSNWETNAPLSHINDIEFDQAGVAWIATGGGLVKYDGEQWIVFDPTNSPLSIYTVSNISIAPNGHIWVNNSSSSAGGDAIYDFDGVGTWTRYRVPDDLPWAAPWEDLSSVMVDRLGHVWVSNRTLKGLAEFDGISWTLHGGNVRRFSGLIEDQSSNIWMRAGIGGGNSFFKFDHINFTEYPISTTPLNIAVDDNGDVYTSDWFGNVRKTINGGTTWSLYLTGLNQVYNITPDPNSDDVWIGTPGAVGHFTGSGALVHDYNSYNTGMPWYWVDYMSTDNEGNFWVATGEAGISRFDGQRWRNWGDHNAGSEPYPFAGNEPMASAYQDSNGIHWFGGNGIARWNSQTDLFTGFWNWKNNPGMGVTMFPYFAEDATGTLFAASEYGSIYRFDTDAELWIIEPVSPYSGGNLPGMQADSQGNVWIAAWFDLHMWDGESWLDVALPNPNYFFDLGGINSMAIGPGDVMWFGTMEGLVRYDGTNWSLYNTFNSPLPALGVQGVAVRADGLIGLSAYEFGAVTPFPNGVAVIDGDINDPANWSVWSYEDSPLPHYQIERCAFDAQGNLWVSTLSEGAAVLLIGSPPIPGDINGDGEVNVIDLLALISVWGTCPDCPEDLDGNGIVDVTDLLIVINNWT